MTNSLILPMAAHVLLASGLYALLTIARAPKIWGIGKRSDGTNPWANIEPRISANLSNQFEWPLFFHTACALLILRGLEEQSVLVLAWLFVLGRLLHTAVQVLTSNVRLRGVVFTVNFLATIGLWVVLLHSW